MRFGIPKEIKAKPKLLGLELKELAIIGVIIVFSLTVFGEMVHKVFVIPFYVVVSLSVLYLFSPSSANPKKKNYHSIFLWARRDRGKYHAIDINQYENERILTQTIEENKQLAKSQKTSVDKEKNNISSDEKIEMRERFINETGKDSVKHEQEDNLLGFENHQSVNELNGKEDDVVDSKVKTKEENTKEPEIVKEYHDISRDRRSSRKKEEEREMGDTQVKHKDNDFQGQRSRKDRNKVKKNKLFPLWVAFALFLSVASIFLIMKLDLVQVGSTGVAEDEEQVEQEKENERVVKALRSFSLKNYEEAMNHFDGVDYETLSDDDKDVMLLSYLFGGNAEKALALEPNFDETVASYYKATFDMQKIRDLSEKVDSKVLEFEVAVDDMDYEKIVELKDLVKMKDDRDEVILEAMLELGDVEGAKKFASANEPEKLMVMVKEYEEKKDNKNKSKKKGDK